MIAPWAKQEAEGVNLGDERLNTRLKRILSTFGNRPNLSIPAACGGRADMEAAYRFFNNDKATFEKVLQPHIERTIQRVAEQQIVLMVQDTTELDVTRPEQKIVGVGELDGSRHGVLLHEMQAFTTDGTPLGTVSAEIVNRVDGVSEASADEKNQQRKHTPIEEKETMRWLSGLRNARAAAEQAPQVQCVCVGDSEADIFELFAEPHGPMHLLIRACQDRALQGDAGTLLREQVLSTPVLYRVELKVRGRKAKTAAEDRARRQNRETRQAKVQVRATRVTLRPPWRFDRRLPAVSVNVVMVREAKPPAGEEPIEWILLTTLPIDTRKQVRTIVKHYRVRWHIEILFRTLKSGCRIEDRRFEHVDRLLPCLAVYLIVAWRTYFVCRMGRDCPDVDCEAIFEPSEWKAVWMADKDEEPPEKPPRLSTMVHLMASLGGYVERKNSEPGPQTVWIGLQRMYDLAWAWDRFGPGSKHRVS